MGGLGRTQSVVALVIEGRYSGRTQSKIRTEKGAWGQVEKKGGSGVQTSL